MTDKELIERHDKLLDALDLVNEVEEQLGICRKSVMEALANSREALRLVKEKRSERAKND